MPSPAEVANFQRLIRKLGTTAGRKAVSALRTADPADFKDAYPDLVDPYISASATLTAQWYHDLDEGSDFPVEAAPPVAREALLSTAGWVFSQANAVDALIGSTERHVFTASRDTVMLNARREKVRFARYASEDACPWCQVLSTREAVYYSEDAAVAGHDNCHCVAVPVRGDDQWTPPEYVDQWMQDYNAARDEVGGNLNDIVNYMRRNQ